MKEKRTESNIGTAFLLGIIFGSGVGLNAGWMLGMTNPKTEQKPGTYSYRDSAGNFTVIRREINPADPSNASFISFAIRSDGSRLVWINSLDSTSENAALTFIKENCEIQEQVDQISLERGSQRLLRVQDSGCIKNIG